MAEAQAPEKVLLTGATGFVGGYVLKRLIDSGHVPVCLVRDEEKFARQTESLSGSEIVCVKGDIFSARALRRAAEQSACAIHLVGIIMERGEQTFSRVHFESTKNIIKACQDAGIKRYVHMSALGARPDAVTKYHQTKYMAEEAVKRSGLDWTIFQPSIIHGPNSEFLELMKTLACGLMPPFMPHFGDGSARLQPVDVRDVAECFVKSLSRDNTIHHTFALGGPRTYSWKELYQLCRRLIPGAKQWKPIIGQPVTLAKLMARTVMKVPGPVAALDKLRFDVGQVQMTQEDSVCDITAAESALKITFRDFERELAQYANQIR